MLQAWIERGVYTFAGYIIGFPGDTKESIVRDIEIIKRELPITVLEFFNLTPLPGSKDHLDQVLAKSWIDPDLNKFDLHHRVTHHPRMSDEEWQDAYAAAWRTFYTDEHLEVVARRHAAQPEGSPKKAAQYFAEFKLLYEIEGVHPLDGGMVRLKHRRSRRPSLRREPALVFYPKFLAETAVKLARYYTGIRRYRALVKRIKHDPARYSYTDTALARSENAVDELALFRETRGGAAAVETARVRADRARRAGLVKAEG
jgi:hypothetical protein